jgi:hypothetical protein
MYANTRARQGKNIDFSREKLLNSGNLQAQLQNDTGDIL